MKKMTFYCRIYIQLDQWESRLMLPLFISGCDKKEVDDAIFAIINSVHRDGNYSNDGFEPKMFIIDHPKFNEGQKDTITQSLSNGRIIDVDIVVDGKVGFVDVGGVKVAAIDFNGKKTGVKINAVLYKNQLPSPDVIVFPPLRLSGGTI